MDTPINWGLLADAVSYYTDLGYKYLEAPWIASQYHIMATCPAPEMVVSSDLGNLVGSSEQSMLQLDHRGLLAKGRYVACTPCFRKDPLDALHRQTFMKVELYANDRFGTDALDDMIGGALSFFQRHISPEAIGVVATGPDTYDIEVNGIEVGSYGMRSFEGVRWVYGTGVAEPRFSAACLLGAKP